MLISSNLMRSCISMPWRAMDKARQNRRFPFLFQHCSAHSTAQDLISEDEIQKILTESSLTTNERISDDDLKLSILKHYSGKYRIPVASNAFSRMETVEDIATWYSYQLRPVKILSHGHQILLKTVKKDFEEEHFVEYEALESEGTNEMLSKLPSNLQLDEKAFRTPQFSLKQKRVRKKKLTS